MSPQRAEDVAVLILEHVMPRALAAVQRNPKLSARQAVASVVSLIDLELLDKEKP